MEGGQKGGQKSGQKGGQKNLGGNRERLLSIMGENPSIARRELSKQLEIAESAVEKHISALKRAGIIIRVGGRKAGHWEAPTVETDT